VHGDAAGSALERRATHRRGAAVSSDPKALADLAKGQLRAKLPQLERALDGQIGAHQRFLLAQQLAHLDGLDELIDRLSQEIAERLRPVQDKIEQLI